MTRDVLARKLARLRTLLADLAAHEGKSAAEVRQDRYAASIRPALENFGPLAEVYAKRL